MKVWKSGKKWDMTQLKSKEGAYRFPQVVCIVKPGMAWDVSRDRFIPRDKIRGE